MFKSLKNFLKMLFGIYDDPFLKAVDQYLKKSDQEIINSLNRPRRKSDFVIQAERKLGLHLPEYY